jgi:DNA topoisomerase-1
MVHLVIVESAAKTKIIQKILNDNNTSIQYEVLASLGHIRDLQATSLSIDIEDGFVPKYEILKTKKTIVKMLKERVKEANTLWLATDCDREGEAIAMHLLNVLKPTCPCYRVMFSEITPSAITKAFANPHHDVDRMLVDAQETRRILDRIVGYKISPLLWKQFHGVKGLSAGRVQSAALAIIVKKEYDVTSFLDGSHHWNVQASFKVNGEIVVGKYTRQLDTQAKAKAFLENLTFVCTLIELKTSEKTIKAPQPFKTSTLQQTAFTKLGLSAAKTMELAQQLYESGYITYMRTDTSNISSEFAIDVQTYITSTYGPEFIGVSVHNETLGAHEAIRPTRICDNGSELEENSHLQKLYTLIWQRTLMSLMSDMKQHVGTYKIGLKNFTFVAMIVRTSFVGFGIVDEKTSINTSPLPTGNNIKCAKIEAVNVWDEPASRYNEASFIRILDKESIGRPSTYTSIIGKLLERAYIRIENVDGKRVEAIDLKRVHNSNDITSKMREIFVGSEKKRIKPTPIGEHVYSFVSKNFPYIADSKFTGGMEDDLDNIASGQKNKLDVLGAFWKVLKKDLVSEQCGPINGVVIVDGDISYTLKVARYGPVVQWLGDNGKLVYVGLTPYLQHTKKELEEVNLKDILYLRSMPLLQDDGSYLTYGRYGFYTIPKP